jgi:transposase
MFRGESYGSAVDQIKPPRRIWEVCGAQPLSVTLFYLWQKQFFENGTAAFDNSGKRRKAGQDAKDRTIAALQDKLQRKNEVLSELMEEHVQLKKELGEP